MPPDSRMEVPLGPLAGLTVSPRLTTVNVALPSVVFIAVHALDGDGDLDSPLLGC